MQLPEVNYAKFAYNIPMQKLDKDTLLCVRTKKATKRSFEPDSNQRPKDVLTQPTVLRSTN